MREIFYLLDWLAYPLYILLGVLILWQLYQVFQAQGDYSASYFELERDLARRRQANAITVVIFALEICVLLLGVQQRAVPYLETERSLDAQRAAAADAPQDVPHLTDTPAANRTGGLDLQIGTPLGESDDGIVLTPTLTPTPVGSLVPNAPAAEGCVDDRAFLQVPANGMRVFDPIVVIGTAYTSEFSQAKLEISGPSTNNQYVVLASFTQPVTELSEFGQFVPANYEEGTYRFRLVVFDTAAQMVASCGVTIYLSLPPRTLTPTPTSQGS